MLITATDQRNVYTLTELTQKTLDDMGEPRDASLSTPITPAARIENTRQPGFVADDA